MSAEVTPIFGTEEEKALPMLEPEQYRLALEFLIANGEGIGKTKPVAAYYCDISHLVNRRGDEVDWVGDESGAVKEQKIEAKPLYVIFDLAMWPEANEYGRRLGFKKIFDELAERVLDEGHVNNPTFEIPGVWTAKVNSFDEDYLRRKEAHKAGKFAWSGKRVNIFEPNPEGTRLCVNVPDGLEIPVQWGTYPIQAGGALTIRERDVSDVKDALLSIRKGETSIQDALYTYKDDGTLVAKFDVYGMDPGFCEANYNHVPLKPQTVAYQKLIENSIIGVEHSEVKLQKRPAAEEMQMNADADVISL